MESFRELANKLSNQVSDVRLQHQPAYQKEHHMDKNITSAPTRPQTTHIEAIVTNFTKGGAGFAKEIHGTRDIFIPLSVVEREGIKRGDHVIATTVPNRLHESWTPNLGVMKPAQLFAIHLVKTDEDSIASMQEAAAAEQVVEAPKPDARALILEALREGPYRAAGLAKRIGISRTYTVFDRLREMHEEGIVARSAIQSKADQKQASFVVWALTASELLPTLDQDDTDDLPDV
jgi:DNA-binding HxlR family transcriptional regulator/cold shock CspA family protein